MRFFAFLTLLIIVESVNSHSSNFLLHARRSSNIMKRQLSGLGLDSSGGGLLGGLLGGNPSASPSPASPPTAAAPASTPAATPPAATPPATTPPAATTPSSGDLLGGVLAPVAPVTSAVAPVVSPVTSAVAPVVSPVTSAAGPIVTPLGDLVAPVTSAGDSVITPVASGVGSVVAPVASGAGSVVTPIASGAVAPVVSGAASVGSGVGSAVSSVAPAVPSVVSSAGSAVSSVASPITSGVDSAISSAVPSVVSSAGSAVSSVADPATSGLDSVISSAVPSVVSSAGSMISSVADPATSVLSSPGSILSSVAAPATSLLSSPGSILSSVAATATSVLSSPGSIISSLAAPATSGLGSVLSSAVPSAGSTISSVLVPVTSVLPSVTNPPPSVSIPLPSVSNSLPSVSNPLPSVSNLLPSVSSPLPSVSNPLPSVSNPLPSESNPLPSVSNPLPSVSNPLPSVTNLLPSVSNPLPSVSNPLPSVSNPLPSVSNPLPSVSNPLPSVSNPVPPTTPIASVTTSAEFLVSFTSADASVTSILPLPNSVSNSVSDIPSASTPSLIPLISFPQPSTTTVPTTISNAPLAKTTTVSIDPQISFILSLTSLALNSIPTTPTISLTNPDQASSTASSASVVPTSLLPLPSGMPARIYPPDLLNPSTDLTGYTFIALLFDQQLNWPFVVTDPDSSTQIFAYIPIIIATALGINGQQILPYALQVFIPTSYQTPSDADELGTMWLGYVPSDDVTTLAQEILAKQSKFYTGESNAVALDLAAHVNSGFDILSVTDPNPSGPSSGDGGKSRRDTIIGVVSSLGGVAFFVLVFLAYRVMKSRRDHAHRRLSGPSDIGSPGIRPEGRDFDQDSVGGARRRSFYYAEDSLRGFQDGEPGLSVMTERRIVLPGTLISPPVLQESSLNW